MVLLTSRVEGANAEPSLRLPATVAPVIGAWFPQEREMVPDGYREYLDAAIAHAPFTLLTTTMRCPNRQMIEPAVHDWFKQAVTYAKQGGLGMALEFDPRHSIPTFKQRYPDELQERLWLTEIDLGSGGPVATQVTYINNHGDAIAGVDATGMWLERVYSYVRTGSAAIDSGSVQDVTATCTPGQATRNTLALTVPSSGGRKACIIVRVTFDYPSVFGPHLIAFEAETMRQYADVPLAGAMKDEWGFPAAHDGNPNKNGYWFSRHQAEAYAKISGGRELVRDSLLMWLGETGREAERQAAVNQVMELHRSRCSEIEQAFYRTTEEVFGANAFVGTHDTVFPYPDAREFERNGLNWWTATRDFAQTDEITPYSCRTSLSKKFGGLWYNQWYDSSDASYGKLIWSYALAGGRMNFHVLWPHGGTYAELGKLLLRSPVLRADCRIRLLNFITTAPLDCPVAVIFGHANAMNWAGGSFEDLGTTLTDALWQQGLYADLIPSSEIGSKDLRVAADGSIWYGRQRYSAVVLYRPDFEQPTTAAFFTKAAAAGTTSLYRVGEWTRGLDGKPFAGNAALPQRMQTQPDVAACAAAVTANLAKRGQVAQTKATVTLPKWNDRGQTSVALPSSGQSRLTDGTVIVVAGEQDMLGDPIRQTLMIDGHTIAVDALGIVAVRLDSKGQVEAFAAGGLNSVSAPGLQLDLAERTDLALWRDAKGAWHGVLQGVDGPVPAALTARTSDWLRLAVPTPLQP